MDKKIQTINEQPQIHSINAVNRGRRSTRDIPTSRSREDNRDNDYIQQPVQTRRHYETTPSSSRIERNKSSIQKKTAVIQQQPQQTQKAQSKPSRSYGGTTEC